MLQQVYGNNESRTRVYESHKGLKEGHEEREAFNKHNWSQLGGERWL